MKKLILIICIFLISASCSNSQTVKSYGIKIGFLTYTQDAVNNNPQINYDGNGTGFGADVGLFIECAAYKQLNLCGEIHLSDRGVSASEPGITEFFDEYGNYKPLSNRYRYLTLQTLAKFNFTKKETGLYWLIGLSTDLMFQNYYSGESDYQKLPNNRFELGGVFGPGVSIGPGFLIELRYNPNFTKTHKYNSGGNDVSFWNSSLVLSFGFCKSVKK